MREEKPQAQTDPQTLMLAYLCVNGLTALPEKVAVLDRFRTSDTDVAVICDCTIQSVRNARQKAKKKKEKAE
jgi:hypothetical protein